MSVFRVVASRSDSSRGKTGNSGSRRRLALAALSLGSLAPVALHAQTAHYDGVLSTVVSNLYNPAAVAVDGNGNLYITVYGDLYKETLSNGSYTQSTIDSGLNGQGVVVDSSGNLYIGDMGTNSVYKETLSNGGYTRSTIASGLNAPTGVAVDGSGNVYISDNNNDRVLKETPSSGGYIPNVIVSGLDNPDQPLGVAVDGSGNVYIATAFSILKETLSNGSYTQRVIVSGINLPFGLVVDDSGNLYISEPVQGSVLKETLSNGSYTQSTLASVKDVEGLAVDGSGNLYIVDPYNGRVLKLQTSGFNFGAVNIGATSPAATLTFTFDTGGSGVSTSVLAQGATGLDFTDNHTGTCTTNGTSYTYNAGDTCTIDVVFTPRFAGTRYGAAELLNSSGTVIATGYVYGTGEGPQLAFAPSAQTIVASSLPTPSDLAVDGNDNLYISNTNYLSPGGVSTGIVYKETPSGSSYIQSTTVGSGLSDPQTVVVDGAGDVYIADEGNNTVYKETPSGTTYIQSVVAANLNQPTGVAVDGVGNVYIAEAGNSQTNTKGNVYKETLSEGNYSQSTVLSGLAFGLSNVVVDGNGNVYIEDEGSNTIVRETPSGGIYTPSTVISNLTEMSDIVVDGAGNLYISEWNNSSIVKLTPSASGYIQSTVGSGFEVPPAGPGLGGNGPTGVALDNNGNVYVSDAANSSVYKVDISNAPTLTFESTPVGTTSPDSPKTVTVSNIGNQPLIFPIPATNFNPNLITPDGSFSWNSSPSTSCPLLSSSASADGTLAAGGLCTLPISFKPTVVGPTSGSLVLTDNTLGATAPNYKTQTIVLNGTGAAPVALDFTVTGPSSAQVVYPGSAASFSIAVAPTLASGDYPYPVALSVTGLPAGFTATFTPQTMTPGTSTLISQLVVRDPAFASAQHERGWSLPYEAISACLLLPLLGVRRVRRKLPTHLLAVLLLGAGLAATLGISGCGSGGTPPGAATAYTLTVTGTGSDSLVHSTTVSLNVLAP